MTDRMIAEANASIRAAYLTPPPVVKVRKGWESSVVALQQMYESNLINRSEYLERVEGLAPVKKQYSKPFLETIEAMQLRAADLIADKEMRKRMRGIR